MTLNRILVTGAGGFVGQHLLRSLSAAFPAVQLIGTALNADNGEKLDITDENHVRAAFARFRPDVCIHLAGITAIGMARADPMRAWTVNLHGTLNIANAILAEAPQCRMIFASSAECYGSSFKPGLAVDETAPLAPMNVYAATKAATELALGAMAWEGLRLVRLRPFNHTGPGQNEDFVVPSFAVQIARIEAGLAPAEINVGALDPERDFLDIRDVCAAYIRCIEAFDNIPNNQIFNIASGKAIKIGTVLDTLLEKAKCRISVRQDPSRLRPVEIARAVGESALARASLGWQPRFSLDDTLSSVLDFARQKYAL